jgi:hypothetical protein
MTSTRRTTVTGSRNGIPLRPYIWRGKVWRGTTASTGTPDSVKALASVNAAKTHCPKNHPYTEENTYRSPSGRRICRTCQRERHLQRSRDKAASRSSVNLSDPCVAAILQAASQIRWNDYTRAEIAALAVTALRDAGLLPPPGAAT